MATEPAGFAFVKPAPLPRSGLLQTLRWHYARAMVSDDRSWARRLWTQIPNVFLGFTLLGAAVVGACERHARPATGEVATSEAPAPTTPSLRLYLVSTLAGAMEPCGCRKDMLGGVDHAAAMIKQGASEAPHSLVLAAGPLFFMEPEVNAANQAKDQQDRWKADAIASALAKWELQAWAPGINDFGRGKETLETLRKQSGSTLLAANLTSLGSDVQPTRIVERDGIKVGITGITGLGAASVTVPVAGAEQPLTLNQSDAQVALKLASKQLDEQGAAVKVVLISAPRGEAMRLLEAVPEFDVAVLGKPKDAGENNDAPTPPALVGKTLVVQGPNHLQAIPIVDLFIRGDKTERAQFADASGIAVEERRSTLQGRITDLTKRIDQWRTSGTVQAADITAREADLTAMRKELDALPQPAPPKAGNFFRYQIREVREGLGSESEVFARIRSYYKRVNEHNRVAFKDREPVPAEKGKPTFVGGAKCESCHEEAVTFWKTTRHARAYKTLEDDFKEFNLDCVGCHVTGYEMPSGSTVTFVEGLKDVQCEVCHAAGSIHVREEDAEFITLTPPETLCSKCHHPPHVADDWDVKASWKQIIGPGHGQPLAKVDTPPKPAAP